MRDNLVECILASWRKACANPWRTLVSGILAGIMIGIGCAVMLVVKADPFISNGFNAILSGACFSVGLLGVVSTGGRLITGDCLMLTYVFDNGHIRSILASWAIVLIGNLIGSLLMALALYATNAPLAAVAVKVASLKCSAPYMAMFVRAILCNVCVCLAVWMCVLAKTVGDRFLACFAPVMTFVACGFEHCVANMTLIPLGMAYGANISLATCMASLLVVTAGNVCGGAILALLLWFTNGENRR